jgi:hypothetical protein
MAYIPLVLVLLVTFIALSVWSGRWSGTWCASGRRPDGRRYPGGATTHPHEL